METKGYHMKNLKIKTKLLLQTLFLLLCLVCLGLLSLVFMSKINKRCAAINDNWLPSVIAAEDLNTLLANYRIKEYGHIIAQEQDIMNLREEQMAELVQKIQLKFSEYEQLKTNDTDEQLIASARQAWSRYLDLHNDMMQLSRSNQTEAAMVIARGESQALFDEAAETFMKIVNFNKAGGQDASHASEITYERAILLTVFSILIFFLAGLFLSISIIKTIMIPVRELDQVAAKISDGDLNASVTYRSRDELGTLAVTINRTVTRLKSYIDYIQEISDVLNRIADGDLTFRLTYDYAGEFEKIKQALEHISGSMNDVLRQIGASAQQVLSGSEQVSNSAQSLALGASEQAGTIEELATSMGEISVQIDDNAANAALASEKAVQVGRQMSDSTQRMQQMTAAMTEIIRTSHEIGNILKTIEDVALQTNILALNASVEAARAGDAGRGFTVIANEVRNLAEESSRASRDTSALVESATAAVESGAAIASEAAASIQKAAGGAREVADIMKQISQASMDQARSTASVNQGIEQITSVVQNNSATAEENAAASEEFSSQAQLLKNLVERFRLRDTADFE